MTHPVTAPFPAAPRKKAARKVPLVSLAPVDPPRAAVTVGLVSGDASLAAPVRAALGLRAGAPDTDLVEVAPGSGLDGLLVPGIAAVIADIEADEAGLARLARLAAIGPDAPLVALVRAPGAGAEIAALEAGASEAVAATREGAFNGAELATALRRATARHSAGSRRTGPSGRETQAPPAAPLVLVQEAPDAMVVLDRHGAVAFVNPAAEDLLGQPASALMGRPFALALNKGEEITIVQPGGETRTAEVDVVETERGGVPARVATFTDTTIRRKLEAAVKAAQGGRDMALKRSSRFFSRVSHDLRTPLTHIVGFADLLQHERFAPDPVARDYAASISEAGRTMLDMVEDLFSVVETDAAAQPEPCDLVKLVRNTASFVAGAAGGGGLEVTVDAPPERLIARVDLARLQRALYRLVSGIARGAEGPGLLRLGLRRTGQQARLTIRLDGAEGRPVPLPASLDDHDPLVTPADARTGFAAELVRETLEAHGGALQLARDGGQVVAAVLTLPLRD